MNLIDLASAVLLALLAWGLIGLVVAILLGRVIRAADRLEQRAGSLEKAVRALPRQHPQPARPTPATNTEPQPGNGDIDLRDAAPTSPVQPTRGRRRAT